MHIIFLGDIQQGESGFLYAIVGKRPAVPGKGYQLCGNRGMQLIADIGIGNAQHLADCGQFAPATQAGEATE
ncbi:MULTISPECIES: hypothetical protein [Enterobacterales]|uniref:hypothetical protein n=1 Tax=Enterobacterales TaxID=91347 RepID=UPI001300B7B0|nr:hypothetical protein [Edaphovirga cremea]